MARQMVQTHTGLPFTLTDGGSRFMVGKDACHDSLAWADLDGDGTIDLVAIATASGNYEDTDHELVAIHVPTGNVGWRALPGEVSKRVSMVDGVIVASTRAAERLVGLDPRTGQKLWDVELPDGLEEDNFDDERARAIAPLGGGLAAIQCKDDSYHLVDSRTGRLVRSGEGKWKSLGAGVPGVVAIESDDTFEVIDVARGKTLLKVGDTSQLRVVPGPGYFGLLRHGQVKSNGAWGFEARVFDQNSLAELGRATLVHERGEGGELRIGDGEAGVIGGCILAGNRLVFGHRHHEEAYVVDLVPNKECVARVFAPPKPGHVFRGLAYVAPALVVAWEKSKGTSKLVLSGVDPGSLRTVWSAEDLGGRSLANPFHFTGNAILAPRNPGANHNEFDTNTNPCAIRHLDPSTGQVLTEYPVEDVDCIEMNGHFLCGAPTYFSGGLPIVYDTNARTRVL